MKKGCKYKDNAHHEKEQKRGERLKESCIDEKQGSKFKNIYLLNGEVETSYKTNPI